MLSIYGSWCGWCVTGSVIRCVAQHFHLSLTVHAQAFGLHKEVRIATTSSWGYIDLLRNWVHWVRRLGFQDYIVIAEDIATVRYLQDKPLYTHVIDGPSVILQNTVAHQHGDVTTQPEPGFSELVMRRPAYLSYLLAHWHYVLYSDVDVIWLRDPFHHLVGDFDFEASVDRFEPHGSGMRPHFCTGFMLLSYSWRTKHVLAEWDKRLQAERQPSDQPVFNDVLHASLRRQDVSVRDLDMRFFTSGLSFFAPAGLNGTCRGQVVTAHVNWFVGVTKKIELLKAHGLWFSPSVPCWSPEITVNLKDGSTRCVVEDFVCLPRVHGTVYTNLAGSLDAHEQIPAPVEVAIVFNAHVAANGVVLDPNGRLYGGVRLDSPFQENASSHSVVFASVPLKLRDESSASIPLSLEWLSQLCASLAPSGGLATLGSHKSFVQACVNRTRGPLKAFQWLSSELIMLAGTPA